MAEPQYFPLPTDFYQSSRVVKFYVLVNRATAFKDPVTKSYKRPLSTHPSPPLKRDIKLIVHIKLRVIAKGLLESGGDGKGGWIASHPLL